MAAPTETSIPTATSTAIPPTFTPTAEMTPEIGAPTPLPTLPIIAVITPDPIQLERWKEYENALAKTIFNFESPEYVLCEWEILGQSEQEVYVWAVCQDLYGKASMPAVIYLDKDGAIKNVATTENSIGTYGDIIRRLFPPNIQEIIFGYLINEERLMAHLDSRREKPSPPLIVLDATPTP
jgi:hypothetical protein